MATGPSDVEICAKGLIATYGQVKFTLGETAKILRQNPDRVAAYLHDHGVTVERIGNKRGAKKLVSVCDIARIAADRSVNVAAIRND